MNPKYGSNAPLSTRDKTQRVVLDAPLTKCGTEDPKRRPSEPLRCDEEWPRTVRSVRVWCIGDDGRREILG